MAGGLRSLGSGVFRLKFLGFFAVLVLGVRAHSSLSTGAVRAGLDPCA
ncbi:Uncharacterised protein [Mycobacterium tuberculosis]|nr:Uncharacterised protein [Mycobacterium tuberculosis]